MDYITIYGDESGVPNEKIQSIKLISGLAAETERLKSDADEILRKYNVSELKSANLKSKKHIDWQRAVEIAIEESKEKVIELKSMENKINV